MDKERLAISLSANGIMPFIAIGSSTFGLVTMTFSMVTLFYYNSVLGVPGHLVGIALALAVLADFAIDPMIGRLSDNLRSKFGRRHPFMYLSVVPVFCLIVALWNPPTSYLSETGAFLYLALVSIGVRASTSLFEVPASSLVPELVRDYSHRTLVLSMRASTMWGVSTIFLIAIYGYWLAPTSEYPDGLLNPFGYQEFGVWIAIIAAVTILGTSIGLHRHIQHLHVPPSEKPEGGTKSETAPLRPLCSTGISRR